MNKISTVIITYNEEKNIARCLDSVQEVSDEILVIDSFSTDQTKKIAEDKGAKFVGNPFESHIQQKNFALSMAKYDHVLSLDADEALSEKAKIEIKKTKEKWTYDSYSFNRLTQYCGKWIRHCGWYPDRKVRLMDRRKAGWGGRNPHDKIEIHVGSSNKALDADILHYSFPTISAHVKTANDFSEIAARSAIDDGKKIYFALHIILNPIFTFLKKYFLQLGLLDGFYGFIICIMSAHANFLKYIKIWQLKHENSNIKNGWHR